MVANPSPTRPFSYVRTHTQESWRVFGPAASKGGAEWPNSHGSSSFVMPLEGSGSVARPFCCRAGAWWPALAPNKAI